MTDAEDYKGISRTDFLFLSHLGFWVLEMSKATQETKTKDMSDLKKLMLNQSIERLEYFLEKMEKCVKRGEKLIIVVIDNECAYLMSELMKSYVDMNECSKSLWRSWCESMKYQKYLSIKIPDLQKRIEHTLKITKQNQSVEIHTEVESINA